MSMESAAAFYEKLETDDQLRRQVNGAGSQHELEKLVKDELGYDFTQEEMQEVIFEKNPVLSDEELEAVVGGSQATQELGQIVGLLAGGAAGLTIGSSVASAAAA